VYITIHGAHSAGLVQARVQAGANRPLRGNPELMLQQGEGGVLDAKW